MAIPMTAFTVILPHLRNTGNDAALRICLDMLTANTHSDFTLLMDAVRGGNLYATINKLVEHAPTDCCLFLASDTFVSTGYDVPMLELFASDTFITGVVCEPGVIGINPENIGIDFGRTPETYRRAEFEEWCKTAPVPSGIGFPGFYMFPRMRFLEMGGLDDTGLAPDHHNFTNADDVLFDKWRAAGNRILRARSYVYHLQRYSQIDEQTKPARFE